MSTLDAMLHVWCNGADSVVATDEAHANWLWSQQIGDDPADYGHTWTKLDPSTEITLCIEDGAVCEVGDGEQVTKTAGEWIATFGAGWLASTET